MSSEDQPPLFPPSVPAGGIQFERPIGAAADTVELEYVTALHQTELRTDATIEAKDLRNYLTSRHGLFVSPTVLEGRILQELCGTLPHDDFATSMDLCQMVTLLCIPFLRQEDINEANKTKNSLNHGFASQVLKLILEELERAKVDLKQFRAVDENFETGTRITPKLVQVMLDAYGEYHVPDEVLQEMVQMASGEGGGDGDDDEDDDDEDEDDDDDSEEFSDSQESQSLVQKKKKKPPKLKTKGNNKKIVMLTKDTFQRALTADIQLYQPSFELQQTTHLTDVQSLPPNDDKAAMEAFYNAPAVDQAADHYRSPLWLILLWVASILYWIGYVYNPDGVVKFDSCNNQWGCDTASAVVNWLITLAQFAVQGIVIMYLGSLGNATLHNPTSMDKCKSILGIFLAMAVVAMATIVPNFVDFGNAVVSDFTKLQGWDALYWTLFAIGILILILQFIGLLANCGVGLGPLGAGGRTRTEQCTKQAATKKLNILVENAMLLHVSPILAGEKPKPGRGWRFPAKHASETVVRAAEQLHNERDNKGKKYRASSNVETLTGGDGSLRAMRHYQAMTDVTEPAGGFWWAVLRLADGRLQDEEGIWLSARLWACNVVQWMVVIGMVVGYVAAMAWFDTQKENTVAVGKKRRGLQQQAQEEAQKQTEALRQYVEEYEQALREKQQQQLRHLRRRAQRQRRRLQFVEPFNSTHYQISGEQGVVYPNPIYDFNLTHFTDGDSVWPYTVNSHNGTHVFNKYFQYNSTGFTDGKRFYPFAEYATNGTHITNGEYLFDGLSITAIPGNTAVNDVEKWEFQVGLAVGLAAALLATVCIAAILIPSFVSTVIKFRSGIHKSMRCPDSFQKLRDSPPRVTTLLGMALWGSVFSGLIFAFFVGGIAFLSVWSETRSTALHIYALLIGFLAAYLVYFAIGIKLFRDLYVAFFYRRHPAAVNIINVILESCNLALGIGRILLRSVKHLIIAVIYIGRIDVPTFAPGAGYVGPWALDNEHVNFKHDLLIHEAHRHPYIERLGMMYLMKLHHGSDFGSRAGAYWRMLFVLALMPWLREYRIKPLGDKKPKRDDDDSDDEDSDDEFCARTIPDNESLMSLHGMDLELDLLRRANDSLAQRNVDLKDAVSDLRKRLRAANREIVKHEKRAEKHGLSKPKSKPKKEESSSVDGASNSPRAVEVEDVQSAQEEANEDDDEDESFESEADTKKSSVKEVDNEESFVSEQNEPVSGEEREVGEDEAEESDDESFESDDETELDPTFSQVFRTERAKLVEQVKQSDDRDDAEPVTMESAEFYNQGDDDAAPVTVEEDDNFESESEDDEPLIEVPNKQNAEQSESQRSTDESKFETDDDSEFESEESESARGEESLADVLKKNQKAAEKKALLESRDPV